jgi:trans-aconitate methyltransferase
MDPSALPDLPVDAKTLIAGCGTGRQVAIVASKYPEAIVTAIDVSQTRLDYGTLHDPG